MYDFTSTERIDNYKIYGGILLELKLSNFILNFEAEKIELTNYLSLSEEQVIGLGVNALGDRIRLEERVRGKSEGKLFYNLADLIKFQRMPFNGW